MYILQIIGVQESLQQAISQMGLDTAKYAYVYDYISDYDSNKKIQVTKSDYDEVKGAASNTAEDMGNVKRSSLEALVAAGIDSTYYKAILPQYVEEDRINNSCIKGGMTGIHTFMSSFMSEGEDIDIILSYSVKIPIPILSIGEIPFLQRVRIRGFTGVSNESIDNDYEEDGQEGEKKYVYITETGSVYHLTKECTYLKLSIEETNYNYIANLRNDSGGKYYPCTICTPDTDNNQKQNIYITQSGDRYHRSLSCSGLKRTILTITLEQVGNKTLCSRCR